MIDFDEISGDNKTPSKDDTPSKSEKSVKESVKKEEKEPERRGSTSSDKPSTPAPDKVRASFPALPSNTTDSVRIKCRELLCAAIKGDEAPVDGIIEFTFIF